MVFSGPFIEHKFKNRRKAKNKQNQLKDTFGYTPEIFSVKNRVSKKHKYYAVIEPLLGIKLPAKKKKR